MVLQSTFVDPSAITVTGATWYTGDVFVNADHDVAYPWDPTERLGYVGAAGGKGFDPQKVYFAHYDLSFVPNRATYNRAQFTTRSHLDPFIRLGSNSFGVYMLEDDGKWTNSGVSGTGGFIPGQNYGDSTEFPFPTEDDTDTVTGTVFQSAAVGSVTYTATDFQLGTNSTVGDPGYSPDFELTTTGENRLAQFLGDWRGSTGISGVAFAVDWLSNDGGPSFEQRVYFTAKDNTPVNPFVPQGWRLTFEYYDQNPTITSSPVTTANKLIPYSYDVDATSEEGLDLVYELATAPGGVTINSGTGLINWTPTVTGVYPFDVLVTSTASGTDAQNWTVTVFEDFTNTAALQLNGTDEILESEPNKVLEIENEWTIGMWTKPGLYIPQEVGSDNRVLFHLRGTNNRSAILAWGSKLEGSKHEEEIHVETWDQWGKRLPVYRFNSILKRDEWKHFACTWDGTSLLAYDQGELVTDQFSFLSHSGAMNEPTGGRTLRVGGLFENTGPSLAAWSGILGHKGIWDVALAPEEFGPIVSGGFGFNLKANSGSYVSSARLKHYYRPGDSYPNVGRDYVGFVDIASGTGATATGVNNVVIDQP
jgi:hypothetical protein